MVLLSRVKVWKGWLVRSGVAETDQGEVLGLGNPRQDPVEVLLPHVTPVQEQTRLHRWTVRSGSNIRLQDQVIQGLRMWIELTGCFCTVVESRCGVTFWPVRFTVVHKLKKKNIVTVH